MMADDKPHSHLTGRKPHFTLGARLGTGNHSEVYHAVDEETGEDCAVKVESIVHHTPMLLFESKLLRSLAKEPYMPLLRNRGYLLMDLKYVPRGAHECSGGGPPLELTLTPHRTPPLTGTTCSWILLALRFMT